MIAGGNHTLKMGAPVRALERKGESLPYLRCKIQPFTPQSPVATAPLKGEPWEREIPIWHFGKKFTDYY